jgi:uncharacterized repeat protein (TIGR01451 family)
MTHALKTNSSYQLNKIRDLGCRSVLAIVASFGFSALPTAVYAQAAACVTGETLQNFNFPAGSWTAGTTGPYNYTVGTGVNAVTLTFQVTNAGGQGFAAPAPDQFTIGNIANGVRVQHIGVPINTYLSTQNVTFSRPVNKLNWVATDVDSSTNPNGWQDQIQTRVNGATVPTSMVSTGGATFHSIVAATGTATSVAYTPCGNTDDRCNVTSNFNISGINTAKQDFLTGPQHLSGNQFTGWANFAFCAPDIPTITIGTPITVTEGAFTQNLITLSAASVQTVTVTLGTTFGTAVAADIGAAGTQTYSTNGGVTFIPVPVSGILTIPAGVTAVQVRTTTIDDVLTEPAETFSLNISAPTGAVLGAAATQTVQNTISASDPVLQASIVIAKTDSKATTSVGGTNAYVVTLTNQGPSAANGVIVTDVVGAGLTCPPANAVTCSVTGVGAVCPAGPLTISSLTTGVAVATLPPAGALQFAYTCSVN